MEENLLQTVSTTYDPLWVGFSIVIAIFAAYTALDFARYVTKTQATTYRFWLACGAMSMGIGIWSMHFVGMMAYQLPLPVQYDVPTTLLSLLVAIAVSCFALFVISRDIMNMIRLTWGGILMGLGIAAMHYSGMAAVRVDGEIHYQTGLLVLSIGVAIVVSMVGLWLAFRLRDDNTRSLFWQKIASAIVTGFAIAGTHYTGMAATLVRTARTDLALTSAISDHSWLVISISAATLLLLILSLVAIRVDQVITTQNEALQVSNLRNQQIMDNAAEVIVTINDMGIIESFNRSGERVFGYRPDEVVGRNVSCLMPEPHAGQHDAYLERYKKGEHNNILGKGARELVALHKNGTVFPIDLSVSAMQVGDQGAHYIGLIRDISERKKTQEALKKNHDDLQTAHQNLQETHEQLLQSEKMASIGQLAAGVAHEINNPVGYIASNIKTMSQYVGNICTLLDSYEKIETFVAGDPDALQAVLKEKEALDLEYVKEDMQDLLNETQEGLSRVKTIVQDLKDFSHVDAGAWQAVDLHRGLDSTLNIANNEIKYCAEVVKVYGDLPLVECLASQINQVFMNMLVNAAHAIEGRGTITIRTDSEDGWAWIEFSDTGKGIEAAHLRKIFDPFFTTKPVGKGTGLGLSLSFGIIKKHGGTIDVKSEVGQGTTFRITLPLQHTEEMAEKTV